MNILSVLAKRKFSIAVLNLLLNVAPLPAVACTDFLLTTTRGEPVSARSMEWAAGLNSQVIIHPREENNRASIPYPESDAPLAMSWKNKFGFAGINANGLDVTVDGLNEKGLSFGLLWLPEYTKYQTVSASQKGAALSITDLGSWVLGNFETVEEVKTALPTLKVWAPEIPSFGGIPTAHAAIHDASGKSIVIEFVNGEQKIYDNPAGVLTNAPTFDWQTINLKNFVGLKPENVAPVKLAEQTLAPSGQGSGFFGIPGDWSPPSRFVRTAAIVKYANKQDTIGGAVNLAQHILNSVDIPQGTIRDVIAGKTYCDYTQWAVIKDLSGRKLYYRSYQDPQLRSIDLASTDFSPGSKRKSIPVGQ